MRPPRWLLTSFNEADDQRDRPSEFAQRALIPREELLRKLGNTLDEVAALFARLTEADLMRTLNIQGYTVTGLYGVYHVVEHFALHYGQITYITKLVRDEDLGFYAQLNRTGRQLENLKT